MKLRHHAYHAARAVLIGVTIAAVILAIALGLFILIWGTHRFLQDFWPLDASRVGPNLVASMSVVILITAHNEYRTAVKAVEAGEKLRQVEHDLKAEVLHPTEAAEQNIADDMQDNASS